jgi:hypothetical protein
MQSIGYAFASGGNPGVAAQEKASDGTIVTSYRLAGWQIHIVAGVAMSQEHRREPVFELRLIIGAVLEAIKFNQRSEEANETATRKRLCDGRRLLPAPATPGL